VQLALASRFDPPLRQHRLRMSGQLCELRDEDLYFSLGESRDLLANFGVQVDAGQLEQLHQASEGWPAAVQMAALSLRGAADPGRIARALQIRSHTIADYFIAEVLDQQPPEVVQFMLDTSILGQLTPAACAAVTGRHDTAAMLRRIDAAHLFLVALDDEQETFRYHRLVRQVLHAELRAATATANPPSTSAPPNTTSKPATPATPPATSSAPAKSAAPWTSCKTASSPTSCKTPTSPAPSTSPSSPPPPSPTPPTNSWR